MRNKILLAGSEKERVLFDAIFQDFLEAGGELFFAEKKEMALSILQQEHPQLVFVDALFFDEEKEWQRPGSHIVILSEHPIPNTNYLLKPLKRPEVMEKCLQVFGAHQSIFPKMPPM